MNKEVGSALSKVRPEPIPGEITSISQLKIGLVFRDAKSDGTYADFRYTVLKRPFLRDGSYWMEVKVDYSDGHNTTREISLADCRITPYESGGWNSTNFTLTEEAIKSKYTFYRLRTKVTTN